MQCQRRRDADGRIIATLEDYAAARELLIDVFTAAATGGVTREVRETVTALRRLYAETKTPVTQKALADCLKLNKSTVWHRVSRACELGFAVNEETRTGRPAKLIPGDELPEERPALPTAEELAMFVCDQPAETAATVQPAPDSPVQDESERTVQNAVSPDVEPLVQPLLPLQPDSKSPGAEPAVERLHQNGPSEHTRADEADRVYVLRLARQTGFTRLLLRPGVSVMEGEEAWTKFVSKASEDVIRTTITALEAGAA
jgi:hypothetical protein